MADRKRSAKKTDAAKRSGGVRPVAAVLPKIAAKAIGQRGFAEATLITDWDHIVGADLARVSQPERLQFARGERSKGTLHVRVQGGVATELQHLTPLVIERINGHFGYGAVARLKLTHAPLKTKAKRMRRPSPAATPASPKQRAQLDSLLEETEDPEIKAALKRFGDAIAKRASEVKKT